MTSTTVALEGTRVLDFTQYYAGPVATHQLALVGAEIIKVEPLAGETMRFEGSDEWSQRGLPPGFVAFNLNKRSLALDVRSPEGLQVARDLVRQVDVVCENFRPGVMDRLGLGYEECAELNPSLVYASVSGFGATGAGRAAPAFDGKIQAMSGLMSISGDAGSGPMRTGVALADVVTGLTAAFAISSALHHRARTGRGQRVDVSMLEAMMSLLSDQVAAYTVRGELRAGAGNLSVTGKPTADRFDTKDGYIVLAVMTEPQFRALVGALSIEEVLEDPRFADWPARLNNRAPLRQVIQEALRTRTTDEWVDDLELAGVPCGPVWNVGEALAHPQLEARGFLKTAETEFGDMTLAGPGFMIDGVSSAYFAASLGQHTAEILTEIGYTESDIQSLKDRGIVR